MIFLLFLVIYRIFGMCYFSPHTCDESAVRKPAKDTHFNHVRHVTGTGSGLLGEIPRVVVQKSALL